MGKKTHKKNNNWVTVLDKCPQINVQFKWHTFKKNRTDGQTNGHTDKRTNGRTVQLYYAPNFISGHTRFRNGLKTGRVGIKIRTKICTSDLVQK